jgi:pimeloyl-ACP methyl ester carboxylesterase
MPYCLANGVRLYYEEVGRGLPVVFIHGQTLSSAVWDDQWPAVSAHYRAVRYDLRGHGRSEAPKSGYTLPHQAGDLCALLDHLGIGQAALVGLSLGGGIALQVAYTCPQRAARLVFVDSTLNGYTYSAEFRRLLGDLRRAIRQEGVQPALESLWLPNPLFAGIRCFPDRFAKLRQMVLQFSGAEYIDDMRYDLPPWKQSERLGEIGVPSLVIVGEHDIEDFQGTSEALYRGITGARKVVIAGAGHIPNMEQPDLFNELLLNFLTGTP